tara:strand:+ start:89 stop:280 length:192 start_codon:yes stop_codon:yes gene_type:complete
MKGSATYQTTMNNMIKKTTLATGDQLEIWSLISESFGNNDLSLTIKSYLSLSLISLFFQPSFI